MGPEWSQLHREVSKTTPEMRTPPLIRTLAWSQLHRKVYKTTPEMRTPPPLIRNYSHACMYKHTCVYVNNILYHVRVCTNYLVLVGGWQACISFGRVSLGVSVGAPNEALVVKLVANLPA